MKYVIPLFCLLFSICCKRENQKEIVPPTITDIEGNVYHTISIGTQVWLVENLKTTKYRNGDPILNITNNTEWWNTDSGAYCFYDNDNTNKNTFGALYNWMAVNDSRGLAPEGWHIASSSEWDELIQYNGGEYSAGNRLKESGSEHWGDHNNEATNRSGFTGLPGGIRYENGEFMYKPDQGYWWSSSKDFASNGKAYFYYMNNSSGDMHNFWLDHFGWGGSSRYGMSIRCIKD